jgi:hypothetical protein
MRVNLLVSFCILGALCLPMPVPAQVSSQPIVVKQTKGKTVWVKGIVVNATAAEITIRDPKNSLIIHTYTLSPAVREAMQKLIETGGYQFGDTVKVRCVQGQTVALAIKGKPSKPL